jgi:5'-nucleotidase
VPKKKRTLLTNDDGYFADGLVTLTADLRRRAKVYVVAPDREQSASSHSLTLNRPLRVHQIEDRRWAIDGTPTDCVMLGIHLLFKQDPPDIIISGINHGANMGDDVTYSGTVAAAIEGAILGVPSVAVSMANYEPGTPMNRAATFVGKLLANWDRLALEKGTFLNINLPRDDGRPYTRYEFTSLGARQYKDIIVHKTDPRGKPYYWIGGRAKWKKTRGTDFEAVARGVISITPLRLNFTDNTTLKRLADLELRL